MRILEVIALLVVGGLMGFFLGRPPVVVYTPTCHYKPDTNDHSYAKPDEQHT